MPCIPAQLLEPPINLSQLANHTNIATFACLREDTLHDMVGQVVKFGWVFL